MSGCSDEKPDAGSDSPAGDPQPGSGEGADTALQALIKKRRLRAEEDSPLAPNGTDTGLPAAT